MKRTTAMWAIPLLALSVTTSAVASDSAAPSSCTPAARVAIDAWVHALSAELPPLPHQALSAVNDAGSRLLALRAYLRAESTLVTRWSWSQDRIDAFDVSTERRTLDDAIARVRSSFESANPGYSLFVNPNVRSVETQLQAWNRNPSIARSGHALICEFTAWITQGHSPRKPESIRAIREHLVSYVPETALPLAAPGLSAHGQMRAVDFHIVRGEEPIAGPDTSSIEANWRRAGWAAKLKAAVDASDGSFRGPLATPDEPWHYEFVPQ